MPEPLNEHIEGDQVLILIAEAPRTAASNGTSYAFLCWHRYSGSPPLDRKRTAYIDGYQPQSNESIEQDRVFHTFRLFSYVMTQCCTVSWRSSGHNALARATSTTALRYAPIRSSLFVANGPTRDQPAAAPIAFDTALPSLSPVSSYLDFQNHLLGPVFPVLLLILALHGRERLHDIVHIITLDAVEVKIGRIKFRARLAVPPT